jgi:DNA-binding MarR family transcriptional regulator
MASSDRTDPDALEACPARPRAGAADTGTRFVDDYLSYLLAQANVAVYRPFDRSVEQTGLRPIEWRMLATLFDQPQGLSITALAYEVLEKHSTVTKAVRRAADKGWLAVETDALDARRVRVTATAAGRAKVEPLIELARRHEARALAGFPPGEVRRFKSMLRRLAVAARASR